MLKKRIYKIITVMAVVVFIVALFLLDTEDHNILGILLAVPAEVWITYWAFETMSDEICKGTEITKKD